MAHCPYCGESLADGAAQCARCGMMLDEDAAPAAAAAVAVASKPAGSTAAGARKTEPCPKCDRPVPVSAHRCKACGHAIRAVVSDETRATEAAFRRNVYLGVAGAVLLAAIVVIAGGFLSADDGPRNMVPAKVTFDELSTMVGPTAKGTASRQKDLWLKYAGKYVRWEGRIVAVEPATLLGDGALLIRHRSGQSSDPDVRVSLSKKELAKPGVAVGSKVNYSGRLSGYAATSPAFSLEDGQVVSAGQGLK